MTDNHDWTRFYRDSRHAFGDGQRFEVEKPSHDWLWGLGLSIFAALLLVAWITYRAGA